VVVRKALLDASDSMEVIGKVTPSNEENLIKLKMKSNNYLCYVKVCFLLLFEYI